MRCDGVKQHERHSHAFPVDKLFARCEDTALTFSRSVQPDSPVYVLIYTESDANAYTCHYNLQRL